MNVNKVQAGEIQNTNACEIRDSVIQHYNTRNFCSALISA